MDKSMQSSVKQESAKANRKSAKAYDTVRNRIKSEESRKEYDRFIKLVRSGELDHLGRSAMRAWLSSRLGVDVSERHFRRVINDTPN